MSKKGVLKFSKVEGIINESENVNSMDINITYFTTSANYLYAINENGNIVKWNIKSEKNELNLNNSNLDKDYFKNNIVIDLNSNKNTLQNEEKPNDDKVISKYLKSRPTYLFLKIKFTKLSVNSNVSIAIDTNGSCYSWGKCEYGCLGLGVKIKEINNPTFVKLKNIKDVSISDYHVVALSHFLKFYTWGTGKYGELAINNSIFSSYPCKLSTIKKYSFISTSNFLTTLIDEEGCFSYFGIILKSGDKKSLKILAKNENINEEKMFMEKQIQEFKNEKFRSIISKNGYVVLLSKDGKIFFLDHSSNLFIFKSKYKIYEMSCTNAFILVVNKEKRILIKFLPVFNSNDLSISNIKFEELNINKNIEDSMNGNLNLITTNNNSECLLFLDCDENLSSDMNISLIESNINYNSQEIDKFKLNRQDVFELEKKNIGVENKNEDLEKSFIDEIIEKTNANNQNKSFIGKNSSNIVYKFIVNDIVDLNDAFIKIQVNVINLKREDSLDQSYSRITEDCNTSYLNNPNLKLKKDFDIDISKIKDDITDKNNTDNLNIKDKFLDISSNFEADNKSNLKDEKSFNSYINKENISANYNKNENGNTKSKSVNFNDNKYLVKNKDFQNLNGKISLIKTPKASKNEKSRELIDSVSAIENLNENDNENANITDLNCSINNNISYSDNETNFNEKEKEKEKITNNINNPNNFLLEKIKSEMNKIDNSNHSCLIEPKYETFVKNDNLGQNLFLNMRFDKNFESIKRVEAFSNSNVKEFKNNNVNNNIGSDNLFINQELEDIVNINRNVSNMSESFDKIDKIEKYDSGKKMNFKINDIVFKNDEELDEDKIYEIQNIGKISGINLKDLLNSTKSKKLFKMTLDSNKLLTLCNENTIPEEELKDSIFFLSIQRGNINKFTSRSKTLESCKNLLKMSFQDREFVVIKTPIKSKRRFTSNSNADFKNLINIENYNVNEFKTLEEIKLSDKLDIEKYDSHEDSFKYALENDKNIRNYDYLFDHNNLLKDITEVYETNNNTKINNLLGDSYRNIENDQSLDNCSGKISLRYFLNRDNQEKINDKEEKDENEVRDEEFENKMKEITFKQGFYNQITNLKNDENNSKFINENDDKINRFKRNSFINPLSSQSIRKDLYDEDKKKKNHTNSKSHDKNLKLEDLELINHKNDLSRQRYSDINSDNEDEGDRNYNKKVKLNNNYHIKKLDFDPIKADLKYNLNNKISLGSTIENDFRDNVLDTKRSQIENNIKSDRLDSYLNTNNYQSIEQSYDYNNKYLNYKENIVMKNINSKIETSKKIEDNPRIDMIISPTNSDKKTFENLILSTNDKEKRLKLNKNVDKNEDDKLFTLKDEKKTKGVFLNNNFSNEKLNNHKINKDESKNNKSNVNIMGIGVSPKTSLVINKLTGKPNMYNEEPFNTENPISFFSLITKINLFCNLLKNVYELYEINTEKDIGFAFSKIADFSNKISKTRLRDRGMVFIASENKLSQSQNKDNHRNSINSQSHSCFFSKVIYRVLIQSSKRIRLSMIYNAFGNISNTSNFYHKHIQLYKILVKMNSKYNSLSNNNIKNMLERYLRNTRFVHFLKLIENFIFKVNVRLNPFLNIMKLISYSNDNFKTKSVRDFNISNNKTPTNITKKINLFIQILQGITLSFKNVFFVNLLRIKLKSTFLISIINKKTENDYENLKLNFIKMKTILANKYSKISSSKINYNKYNILKVLIKNKIQKEKMILLKFFVTLKLKCQNKTLMIPLNYNIINDVNMSSVSVNPVKKLIKTNFIKDKITSSSLKNNNIIKNDLNRSITKERFNNKDGGNKKISKLKNETNISLNHNRSLSKSLTFTNIKNNYNTNIKDQSFNGPKLTKTSGNLTTKNTKTKQHYNNYNNQIIKVPKEIHFANNIKNNSKDINLINSKTRSNSYSSKHVNMNKNNEITSQLNQSIVKKIGSELTTNEQSRISYKENEVDIISSEKNKNLNSTLFSNENSRHNIRFNKNEINLTKKTKKNTFKKDFISREINMVNYNIIKENSKINNENKDNFSIFQKNPVKIQLQKIEELDNNYKKFIDKKIEKNIKEFVYNLNCLFNYKMLKKSLIKLKIHLNNDNIAENKDEFAFIEVGEESKLENTRKNKLQNSITNSNKLSTLSTANSYSKNAIKSRAKSNKSKSEGSIVKDYLKNEILSSNGNKTIDEEKNVLTNISIISKQTYDNLCRKTQKNRDYIKKSLSKDNKLRNNDNISTTEFCLEKKERVKFSEFFEILKIKLQYLVMKQIALGLFKFNQKSKINGCKMIFRSILKRFLFLKLKFFKRCKIYFHF